MDTNKESPEWIDLIDESVHTSDDIDIGDIEAVNNNFVVVKRGFINIHFYYIPVNKVEGWDGHVLWLKVTELFVKDKYEVDKPPDPNYYYVKDFPYNSSYYSPLPLIASRYTTPLYPKSMSLKEASAHLFRCDLCEQEFSTEQELNKHMKDLSH